MSNDSSSRPPVSSRTLQHPTFLPLYLSADLQLAAARAKNHTVPSITPAEFFYMDPTLSCGRRIPNVVSELRVSECFRLNTPPPIMSSCIAPPIRADPFRSVLHHSRDLGSSTVKVNPLLVPPAQLCQVVVQLTQDEDQAISNLLKLHHQEAPPPPPPPRTDTADTPLKYPPSSPARHQSTEPGPGVPQSREARCWSVQEIEAANTLSRFGLLEEDQDPEPADPPSAQSYRGYTGSADLPLPETWTVTPPPALGYSEREQKLSDSERDALHALQSLGDPAAGTSVFNLHSS